MTTGCMSPRGVDPWSTAESAHVTCHVWPCMCVCMHAILHVQYVLLLLKSIHGKRELVLLVVMEMSSDEWILGIVVYI